MTSVTASTGVKLKASTGALSGTTTLTGVNGSVTSNLATITASGKPTKGGGAFSAGNNNGWSLSVTYNGNGTVTGSAAGSWSGISSTVVPVQVDAPGRSRHRGKSKSKSKKKSTPKAKSQARSVKKRSPKKPVKKAQRRR